MAADTTALTTPDVHAHEVSDVTHVSSTTGTPVLGMLLFITSEVMFFAGLFAAYFSIRASTVPWPPINATTGEQFELHALPIVLPATIILVISSFTAWMGERAITRDDRSGFIRSFAVTLALGITFLALQLYDYLELMHEGITLSSGTFGTTFYTLTGFHGAHVLGGVLMLGVVLYRGMAGQFSSKHHDMVLAASYYWHFVDIVWILLFLILYVL
jgi:cytochrome c oxidase subunit 3